jgi:hypothetical protein
MNCDDVIERAYEFDGAEPLPLLTQIRIRLHLLRCPNCRAETAKLNAARSLMRESFFPAAPSLEEAIMGRIALEEQPEELSEVAGFSFKSWVITGLVILVSLSTSFLGMDFARVADSGGPSFLLPVGITVGGVVTAYGAIFIGSHLKQLSARFNLR